MNSLIQLFEYLQQFESLSSKVIQKNFSTECINFLVRKMQSGDLKSVEQNCKRAYQEKQFKKDQKQPYNPLAIPKQQLLSQQIKKKTKTDKGTILPSPYVPKNDDFLAQILNDTQPKIQLPEQPQKQQHRHRANTSSSSSSKISQKQSESSESELRHPPVTTKKKKTTAQISGAVSHETQRSRSHSSDLPEFNAEIKGSATVENPILYDPDAEQEVISKVKDIRQFQPLSFGEQIYRVLPGKFKYKSDTKKFNLELYTRELEEKLKKSPKIGEIKNNRMEITPTIQYLESRMNSKHRSPVLMVLGWVLCEPLDQIGEVNKLAESLLKEKKLIGNSYHDGSTALCLLHYDSLCESSILFKNFSVPRVINRNAFQKKDEVLENNKLKKALWKYHDELKSKLCFILYLKDPEMSELSSFSSLQFEKVENIDGTSEVQKWVDRKRGENDKSRKKDNQSSQPPLKESQRGREQAAQPINSRESLEEQQQQQTTSSQQQKMEQEANKHNFSPVTSEDDENGENDDKDGKKDKEMDEMVLSYLKAFPNITKQLDEQSTPAGVSFPTPQYIIKYILSELGQFNNPNFPPPIVYSPHAPNFTYQQMLLKNQQRFDQLGKPAKDS